MKIAILVEGRTEKAFLPHLREFLKTRLAGRMPNLDMVPYDGRVPKDAKLHRTVENLPSGREKADAVIALTDVYTGTADFVDAADAKAKMRSWTGQNSKFYPHVAQHDFEAWLLPYWSEIQKVAGSNRNAPPGSPESVNHNRPPSYHIKEIFRIGTCRDDYSKVRDANRILRNQDLAIAAVACPELKAFLNRILELSGGQPI
ncbi:MAG: DUF4276 family protein [Terracidiphilus sp.]